MNGYRGDPNSLEAEAFKTLFAIPLLDGQLVSVTIPSGATSAIAQHSLGRAYRGGIVASASSPVAATVKTASLATDPQLFVTVQVPSTSMVAVDVIVWVY